MVARANGGPWRVEWHGDDGATEVARLDQAYAHHTALEPFVTRLQGEGHNVGVVALVDDASNEVVARRRLDRPVYRFKSTSSRQPNRKSTRKDGPARLIPSE
jgi:hypothetical protein